MRTSFVDWMGPWASEENPDVNNQGGGSSSKGEARDAEVQAPEPQPAPAPEK